MPLFLISFFAGMLTVAAPCILPLLPVVVSGALPGSDMKRSWRKPLLIMGSLAVSVIVFTLLLKATTALLGVPQEVWNVLSGLLVIGLGVSIAFPEFWDRIAIKMKLYGASQRLMMRAGNQREGSAKDVLTGVALGPVFSSCSPTYALIVAVVLPRSFVEGFSYLVAYAVGLSFALFLIALVGQRFTRMLGRMTDPRGRARYIMGGIFILTGLFIMSGLDKSVQTYVLDQGWYDPIIRLEERLGL